MSNLGIHGQQSHQVNESSVQGDWGLSEEQREILLAEAESEVLTDSDTKSKNRTTKADEAKSLRKTQATAFADRDHDTRDLLKSMAEKMAKKDVGKSLIVEGKIEQEARDMIEEMAEQATLGDDAGFVKEKGREMGSHKFNSDQRRRDMGIREKTLKDAFKELPNQQDEQQDMKNVKFRKRVSTIPQATPMPTPKEAQEVLTKYLSNFSDGLVRDDKTKKEKARQTRESLITKGFSPRQLTTLEGSVRQVIRQDLKRKLKDSFIKLALSYDSKKLTQDMMTNSQALNMVADQAGLKGLFGAGRESLKGVKDDAKTELDVVVTDELDKALMETKVQGGTAEDLVKAFNKFNDLADIARFDAGDYMKHLNQKLKDWGLTDFTRPDVLGVLDTDMSSDSGGKNDQQQQETPQSEIDILEDDVRAVYVQRAIKGTVKSFITGSLSLRKLVRQMKEKGAFSEERLDDLRQEGESFARFRLFDLVKESLEERAALPQLKGPAFRLVQQKYKHAMKRLKVMGTPMAVAEVRAMRDQINTDMFAIIREEFLKVASRLETMKADIYLIRKHKELLGILKRLKKESKVPLPIHPKGQGAILTLGENSIVEAA